ncbi:phenylalanine 4-monooxygenase [Micromonospora sp. NPDC005215]|uniref:phenylalanine 4-monooxygenase n=1 Tax=Micromonospora sp. NPDC005215 TaxID=3157024 RepID=UPI0033AA34BB
MFEEATVYSPVIRQENGTVSVIFAREHPGFEDADYQRHRARIAELALTYQLGDPVPEVEYTAEEVDLWRQVVADLQEKHRRYAAPEFLDGSRRLDIPTDRLPQLREISGRLRTLTGFHFTPAAGIVGLRDFYGSLNESRFQATQYIRHCSMPYFSPEPDMMHEVVGHGNALANDRLAALYRRVGRAASRAGSKKALEVLSQVFWFTLEYGLVLSDGEPKVYGASLLSSVGELEQFRSAAEVRPLDVTAMVQQSYTVQNFQPVLFCAESFDQLEAFYEEFLSSIEAGEPVLTGS